MVNRREYYLVKIQPNKVRVENLKTGKVKESAPDLMFSNDRLLVTSAEEPVTTIKRFVDQLSPTHFFPALKTIVIHATHPNIHEFQETEKMILRDIGAQVGSAVYLCFQSELRPIDLKNKNWAATFEV